MGSQLMTSLIEKKVDNVHNFMIYLNLIMLALKNHFNVEWYQVQNLMVSIVKLVVSSVQCSILKCTVS